MQSTTHKYVQFDTSEEEVSIKSTSGITLNPLQYVTRSVSGWEIGAPDGGIDRTGFNIHLSLNASWSFSSMFNTTLKVEVYNQYPTVGHNNFLLSFSQKDSNYISTSNVTL